MSALFAALVILWPGFFLRTPLQAVGFCALIAVHIAWRPHGALRILDYRMNLQRRETWTISAQDLPFSDPL